MSKYIGDAEKTRASSSQAIAAVRAIDRILPTAERLTKLVPEHPASNEDGFLRWWTEVMYNYAVSIDVSKGEKAK